MKKRLITSALPYVNNIPHLGNLIQVLSADVFARFCRQRGYETLYVCGSDEYGTATETRALQEKVSPKELCDRFHRVHKDIYDWFGIEFDHYGRTSCSQQTKIVQEIYRQVSGNGFISKKTLEQTYCVRCERFLADRYVHGTCPHCSGENARGDQCEDCGTMLDPTDLLEPRCGTCGEAPQRRETEHLFLDLPRLKNQLEAWIDEASERGRWARNALQMTKSWIRDGLKQRCITRDLNWGVPVPDMPGKVFYVWFDAPIGYISITAELLEQRSGDSEAWKTWWQNPQEVELFQFIGKDNIPFHTVLFPSTQLAIEEIDWTMLHHMSSSEYLNYESGKFSKTRGVGIFGNDCRETGIPADCWRFYLYYNRPEKSDYEFTWAEFQQLLNRELIGNLGNLVNRTLSFLQRFFAGRLLAQNQVRSVAEIDKFLHNLEQYQAQVTEKLEWSQLKDALHDIMKMAAYGNKMFQENEPWAIVKKEPELAHCWISALVFLIHDLAICLRPYLPQIAEQIAEFLVFPQQQRFDWNQLGVYQRLNSKTLPEPKILLQQLEDERVDALRKHFSGSQNERQATQKTKQGSRSESPQKTKNQKQPSKQRVFDSKTFAENIELKVGRILEVSLHPDAERLFIEKIDCGEEEPRTIISGLAEHYRPEELLGKNVAVVANLKPAKLRGIKSMGMILAASPSTSPGASAENSEGPQESSKTREASEGKEILVEVLHPAGQPGDRIVVAGFEEIAAPQQRARFEDFSALPMFLRDTKAYLSNGKEGIALFVQTEQGPRELVSKQLRNGEIS